MSPIEFENYIRGYTGAIGGFALDLIVEPIGYLFSDVERPDRRFDEWPFFKRFLQLDPAKYTQAEAEFYELKRNATLAVNQAKKFKNEFKFKLYQDFMENKENHELIQIHPRLERWGKQLAKLNKRRNEIWNAPDMDDAEKRRLLDQIEEASGIIFDKIMDDLMQRDLEIFDPIMEFKPKPLDWMFPEILFGKK